jgi:hypothetical protein
VKPTRPGARHRLLAPRVFGLHGPFEGRADVSTRRLRCALGAIHVPASVKLLRDGAGLVITRERREIPTIIVQQTEAEYES